MRSQSGSADWPRPSRSDLSTEESNSDDGGKLGSIDMRSWSRLCSSGGVEEAGDAAAGAEVAEGDKPTGGPSNGCAGDDAVLAVDAGRAGNGATEAAGGNGLERVG
eukprot:TRINITY_DN6812_c0_g1_i1.p3 TRINITY_DN6812_c0_g1~~TRINITY_DN6812_c0_g1_i1.p3  ORF type:complete len:106 (+),score=25.61 TRINITY_DN6812_c0_g1_i1:801-1118(+)